MGNILRKLFFSFLVFFSLSLFLAKKIMAVCPICTVAVGIGVGFSRWLGIDDTISGLWIGGLTASLISWTNDWLTKKNIHFKGKNWLVFLFFYLLILTPLYFTGFLGNFENSLFCFCGFYFDKLLLGIISGSVAFHFSTSWYFYLKEKNNGRAYFPFQKVIMPISPLILLSIIFYFLTK
jgi:hypothetical protein